ncbi:MAG: hypothetical protein LBU15_03090, partial [Rickettsiales bacterium]|nr:hypothetical protein [Rickettsiales bacterium]
NQSETARGEMPGHSKFTLVYGRLGVANRIQLGPYSKRTLRGDRKGTRPTFSSPWHREKVFWPEQKRASWIAPPPYSEAERLLPESEERGR